MHGIVGFFWTNGVGQNLTASAILFAGGYLLGRSHLKRIRETHRMIAELHARHGPEKKPPPAPVEPPSQRRRQRRLRRLDIGDLPLVTRRRYRDH